MRNKKTYLKPALLVFNKLHYFLLDPAVLGLIGSVPKKISYEKIVDVAEVNQCGRLEESGQWLEKVDQTHLVMDSGKLGLQKT